MRSEPRQLRALIRLGVGLFLAALVAEHLLETHLDPARHMVSEYARARSGAVMTVGFFGWAAALGLTAALVRLSMRRGATRTALASALAAAGVGVLVLAVFQTETSAGRLPAGVSLHLQGRLHDLGSAVTSAALLAGSALVACGGSAPRRLRAISALTAATALGSSAVLLAIGPSVGGVRQRLVILLGVFWQLELTWRLPGRRRATSA